MTTRKLNEFLDHDDDSDGANGSDGDAGYDSEAAEGRMKGALLGGPKRRRVEAESDLDAGDAAEDGAGQDEDAESSYHTADEDAVLEAQNHNITHEAATDALADEAEEEAPKHDDLDPDEAPQEAATDPDPTRARALRKAARAAQRAHKSGVLYISRVPPFMKPTTLTQLLRPHAPHGGLGRVFLTPESADAHARRVRGGGNKKKSFTDGWVEIASKRDARRAAERLNGQCIGGKKGGFYHDDLWNVRYLRGFKWGHLTEQIANENAARAARVREEVRRTRRENRAFMEDVQRGKMEDGMEGKKRKAGKEGFGARRKMEFQQTTVRTRGENAEEKPSADVRRVLGKIF